MQVSNRVDPPCEYHVQTGVAFVMSDVNTPTAEYQRLALESAFAEKQLASVLASLEEARNEAQRQLLYLETIAKPSLPDEAVYPKRFRGVINTFVLGLVAWGILSMLIAGVKEHQH